MAVRIAGIIIPQEKRLEIALTYIYGIGRSLSVEILEKTGIEKNKKAQDLTDDEINKIRQAIEKEYKVEGDLKRETASNIKRLKEINCYRGIRHAKNLPVRGQTTRINSRTVRGNVKRTAGSGKVNPNQKT